MNETTETAWDGPEVVEVTLLTLLCVLMLIVAGGVIVIAIKMIPFMPKCTCTKGSLGKNKKCDYCKSLNVGV